ncbi:MAG: hypothetical protein R3E32_22645 [Chitinophagales bacterium]
MKMNGLSKYYIKKIINCFADEMTATATSRKLKINRNTVNKYFKKIRLAVADYQELRGSNVVLNATHTNAAYFSWYKSKGICFESEDNSAYQLIEREDKVFVNPNMAEILAATKEVVIAEGEDDIENGHALSQEERDEIEKTLSETAKDFHHYAKEKLAKFYGVKSDHIYLYLKELEFRFNNQDKDTSKIIWKILPHHSR